ncbi:hypothetical protein BIV24_13140 [Streptomyces colonosanans]|uniref:Enoyl-CoA hydratase n=1 Tax=Streptomyces colonosanans TaxID=1428652 RepID=A0A1S2PH07_9ACTN|nr:hypothetical protein BIV24_13140 [Streptomyces colonosanans]
MPVRIERQGHVTTVILSRPEARNAVDGPTATALADAFREFEADESAQVAVLRGELRYGMDVLAEGLAGAARFAAGAGRHGSFTGL